jgi:hypothetical protein
MTKLFAALLLSFSGLTVTIVHFTPPTFSGAPSGDGPGGGNWGNRGGHFNAPEIDPSSAIGALTLLIGGLVVLRSRVTKQ